MKNKGLVLVLLGAGALLLLSAKAKPKRKPYKIIVPPPEKITEEQFRTGAKGIVQKAVPKLLQLFKPKPKLTAQQQAAVKTLATRRIFGQQDFPDFC